MKIGRAVLGLVLLTACFIGSMCAATAQNDSPRFPRPSILPFFTNNPSAIYVITNLMAEPAPDLSMPMLSRTNTGPVGTYWTLKNGPAPMPVDPFPDLPVYEVGTNQYLIDDRSVDYAAVADQQAADETAGLTNPVVNVSGIDTNGLWLQVPTNSLATNGYFSANLMNSLQGQSYDILTKSDLRPPTWATELTVTGAVDDVTPVSLPMNGRTNLFVWARTSVAYSFYFTAEPLSQDVFDGDTVTFYVDTGGNTNLTFQWTFNGGPIAGATNNTYTIYNVLDSEAGYYACIVSDGSNSLTTTAAQLTTEGFSGDSLVMPVVSSRQNYTFKSGMTYAIGSPIQLYGSTTIEAGAVLKFDNANDSSLLVMGGLTCKTTPYNPAILTSIDDDSAGEWLNFSSGAPQTYITGIPYLDLTSATSNSISNLRFLFADCGVTTPVNNPWLDVWDCQFGACNYGIVNLIAGSSTNCLHNVLFAACEAGIGASSNSISIQGEQVTADVTDFCLASSMPSSIALTNSIVWGNPLSASSVSSVNVAMNPDGTNFVSVGEGNYYLAANCPLHKAGTANISDRLQTELQGKTTYPPMAIADGLQIDGQITLSPQVARYTNGAPDLGYYYDALDYTVGSLNVAGGTITVLPGTAIGIRNDFISNHDYWTLYGFYIYQGGSIISHGTPPKPNIFAFADLVQEKPNIYFAEYQVVYSEHIGDWVPGIASFVTDFEPGDAASPTLDFRFSNFYLPATDLHFCSGLSFDSFWIFSASSSVNLSLQDCSLHDGQIDLGQPDGYDFAQDQVFGSGTVTWKNTLFENTSINLDPTFYENGADDQGLNVDMSFQANNNLLRGGQWLHLEPIPASAGNWLFENNLFDQVSIIQDINQPLDFDYNGYWPLTADSVGWYASVNPWSVPNTNYLRTTVTLDGFMDAGHEKIFADTPPYQSGVYGNYYLPNSTVLYDAGSTNAAGLGLFHYTTQTNQFKEGNEASTHMANIGLHYIATSNGVPVDTDFDGIPDYVENWHGDGNYNANSNSETDWQNPMTDGANPDCSNAVYLNVDLSGNGLAGRIKAALGINPLDTSNPLAFTQITTGHEPSIATFRVSINYNLLANLGRLSLLIDGTAVQFQECDPDTNGNCLLKWNTTFDPPGQHYLQSQLTLHGQLEQGAMPDPTVLTGAGSLSGFYSTNICQFDPFYSTFSSSGAILKATTPACPNANYTIELKSITGQHIKTITNSTSTGVISEPWDLTDDNGNVVTNTRVVATFNITLLDPGQGSLDETLENTLFAEVSDSDAKYTIAYAWDDSYYASGTMQYAIQGGVVDPLLTPVTADGGNDDNYDSDFNRYTGQNYPDDPGNPGHLSNGNDVTNLLNNLTNVDTVNFFFMGHGNPEDIGDNSGGDNPAAVDNVDISAETVASILHNWYSPINGAWSKLPYRFVFLAACETANDDFWCHSFGIDDTITSSDLDDNPDAVQAFVGWKGSPRAPNSDDEWNEEGETMTVFHEAWMAGYNLQECIQLASSSDPFGDGSVILYFPLGKKFNIFQNAYGLRGLNNFSLKVYGYPGIKRYRYDSGY